MPVKTVKSLFNKIFNLFPFSARLFVKDITDIVEKMDYKKSDIYLYIDSEVEYSCRMRSCYHEPETVDWIEKFINDKDIVFDIGANIGAYSLIASKNEAKETKIYAFEPNFTSFAKLCKNILLNKREKNIFPFQLAFSDKYCIDYLNYTSLEIGSAYHFLGKNNFYKVASIYKQPVITYSIDQFIEHFNITCPQHIKIDVDGVEFDIIKGAQKTLMNTNFKSLNVEVNELADESKKMIKYIESLGLVFYKKYTDLNADDPDQDSCKIYNYIFISSRLKKEKI